MLLSGIILKPRYEYIKSSFSVHQQHVISLLIHGFLPVNARLLIAFGTAFYAINMLVCLILIYLYTDLHVVIIIIFVEAINMKVELLRLIVKI